MLQSDGIVPVKYDTRKIVAKGPESAKDSFLIKMLGMLSGPEVVLDFMVLRTLVKLNGYFFF